MTVDLLSTSSSPGSQASLDIARPENGDLLGLAAESGCRFLFAGFESINQSSTDETGKRVNKPDMYAKAVKLFHKYGIAVLGAFVFGFDSEGRNIFKPTVEFAQRIRLDVAQLTVLTPLPGTPLMGELKEKGRIVEENWSRYGFATAVFKSLTVTAQELTGRKERARNCHLK